MGKDQADNEQAKDREETKQNTSELTEAKHAAELHLLTKIATSTAGAARDYAEAYALITGTLNAQPVRIKPGK